MVEGVAEAPGELEPGQLFAGRYRIERRLGKGDRKWTYRAEDIKVGDRLVALSVVKPHAAVLDPGGTKREANLLARVKNHNHIVAFYEYDADGPVQYLVFEYLSGGTLEERIERVADAGELIPPDLVVRYGRELAGALAQIHAAGVIHRDVAPRNIWLTDRQKVKLGGFDSAVLLDGEPGLRPITSEGYASPEERHGDPVGQRSDLYSLGGVLMSLALGELGFGDPAIIRERRLDLPTAFHDLLASLVAPSPEDRPYSAQEVLDRLNEIRRRGLPSNLTEAQRGAALSPVPAHRRRMDREFQSGDVLQDRFEVRERLHRARDKSVYIGYDRKFDCQVTIDVFSGSKRGRAMAAWETRVLGKLGDHPNIARVVHHWEDGDTAIMVNRYLPGGNLQDLICYSRDYGVDLAIDRIMRVSTEIANGLAHIHRNRILYCDLRPRNVRFDEFGTVHLVDFDTAVPLGQPVAGDLTDRLMAEYVAPELADGQTADERADLYSLG